MGKTAVAIDLTAIERRELESLASRRKTAQGLAQRARIVLLAAEGAENRDISLRVNAAPNTVGKWRRRFAERRIDGLLDEPRPGAPRQIGDDDVAEVIRQTLETTPQGATHWSLRSMAKAAGARGGSLRRRKEPDSSARSNAALAAVVAWPGRAAHARLHPPRNP